jgi:hypothetical protein
MSGFVQRAPGQRVPMPQRTTRLRVPIVWRILALEQSIAQNATTTTVKYRWQRPLVLVYMQLLCQPFSEANVAGLELSWEDGFGDQVGTSGMAMQTICGRAVMGERDTIGSKWSPIEIRVKHQDIFTFSVKNTGSVTVTPILLFHGVERG